jgi:uncharacterized protein
MLGGRRILPKWPKWTGVMPDDLMRYDLLAQNALKGVVRDALRIAETTGLPGEHHFYIAFNTRHPNVKLSEKISQRYPREMTIVLQHQYWNLHVFDDRFEVELSFDNVPELLVIPFDAVKGFLDPAVQFGLQFEQSTAERKPREVEAAKSPTSEPAAGTAAAQDNPDKQDKTEKQNKQPAASAAQDEATKVVSLDQFRKK